MAERFDKNGQLSGITRRAWKYLSLKVAVYPLLFRETLFFGVKMAQRQNLYWDKCLGYLILATALALKEGPLYPFL